MTFRTRFRVQTSPRNPKCSGPFSRSSGSLSVRSSSESFGGRPGRGEVLSASLPPSRAFFIHWLTAPSLTPRASAMSVCFQPSCFNSKARKRRASRQSGGVGSIVRACFVREQRFSTQDTKLYALTHTSVKEISRGRSFSVSISVAMTVLKLVVDLRAVAHAERQQACVVELSGARHGDHPFRKDLGSNQSGRVQITWDRSRTSRS